jgi:hypothetical protein
MDIEDIKCNLSDAIRQARSDMEDALRDWRDLEQIIDNVECEL